MDITSVATALSALRPRLLRFARLQLRDEGSAEDAVQEALLAATERADQFQGAAAAATWIFAILKNKIVDEFRRRARQPETLCDDEEDLDRRLNAEFDSRDHWAVAPSPWADPDASLEQKRFWQIFEACVDVLPEKPARVFCMRELLGMENEDICKELGISPSNCWVLLHRARMGLRQCLSRNWFGEEAC